MGVNPTFAPERLDSDRGGRTVISPKSSLRRKPRQLGSLPDSCAEPDFELLPDEGAAGGGGGRQRQHQDPFAAWTGLQEPALPAVESPTHGGGQDRIRRFPKSGLKCTFHQILAQSPDFFMS